MADGIRGVSWCVGRVPHPDEYRCIRTREHPRRPQGAMLHSPHFRWEAERRFLRGSVAAQPRKHSGVATTSEAPLGLSIPNPGGVLLGSSQALRASGGPRRHPHRSQLLPVSFLNFHQSDPMRLGPSACADVFTAGPGSPGASARTQRLCALTKHLGLGSNGPPLLPTSAW